MTIKQGDSYPIYIELIQDKSPLVPNMVDELEVCIGRCVGAPAALRKLYSEGDVLFDEASKQWYIHPTQAETLGLEKNYYNVDVRIRYKGNDPEEVVGLNVGRIQVADSISEAVI